MRANESGVGRRGKARPLCLREAIEGFFVRYLSEQRGCSRNTIGSYKEALNLFAAFVRERFKRKNLERFAVRRLTPEVILDFLKHLEQRRGNAATTRNQRLACLRSLFTYLAFESPALESLGRRVLTIPSKVARSEPYEHFDEEELAGVFDEIDISSDMGFRDYAVLYFMYNTGCRASEVAHLRTGDLVFERPYARVRFKGKGGRFRDCPLWESTVLLLSSYLKNVRKKPRPPHEDRMFIDERRLGFTRQGIRQILLKYARAAAASHPSLKRKWITTHSMRHTTAVHLYKSGVDLNTIRAWLGHILLDTTLGYARSDTASKAEALKRFQALAELLPFPSKLEQRPDDEASLRRWAKGL